MIIFILVDRESKDDNCQVFKCEVSETSRITIQDMISLSKSREPYSKQTRKKITTLIKEKGVESIELMSGRAFKRIKLTKEGLS